MYLWKKRACVRVDPPHKEPHHFDAAGAVMGRGSSSKVGVKFGDRY
jgi:hypothetical protein